MAPPAPAAFVLEAEDSSSLVESSNNGVVSRPPPHGHKYLYWNPDEVIGKGSGIYTRGLIAEGEVIMQIVGPAINWKQLLAIDSIELRERYLQVGPDLFFGPAGDYSDKVNHSCEPNCLLKFPEPSENNENDSSSINTGHIGANVECYNCRHGHSGASAHSVVNCPSKKVFLVARRDILPGEEITFDYCTVQCNQTWEMPCLCGSPICRKIVLNILDVNPMEMAKYRAIGGVPDFAYKYWLNFRSAEATARKEFD